MALNTTDNRYGTRVYQGMAPPYFDRVDVVYPNTITEDYAFSTRNAESGLFELMACIRIIYTNTSKALVLSVEKTFKRPETD